MVGEAVDLNSGSVAMRLLWSNVDSSSLALRLLTTDNAMDVLCYALVEASWVCARNPYRAKKLLS